MIFIAYAIHFFMASFAQFYYVTSRYRQNNTTLILFLIPFVGGFFLLGWTAIFTFLAECCLAALFLLHQKNKMMNDFTGRTRPFLASRSTT